MKEIKTPRLLLRSITPEDICHIFKGLSHPEVIKYYGVSFMTLEATEEQMDWYETQEKAETGKWWLVCSSDGEEVYGAGGINDIDKKNRKGEIGFWLLPEYWGKGFMKEAMNAIIDYGFEEMNLHRIEGFVESTNENCKNGLKKMNFELEGIMRDCEMKEGKFISVDIYARISSALSE